MRKEQIAIFLFYCLLFHLLFGEHDDVKISVTDCNTILVGQREEETTDAQIILKSAICNNSNKV